MRQPSTVAVTGLHHGAWAPTSLLSRPPAARAADPPTRAADAPAHSDDEVTAWRCHVREISAEGLPTATSLACEWIGLRLRFVAAWSREKKRTTLTKSTGSFAWAGEHATLALPNAAGRLPTADIEVELCAHIAVGEPELVIGSATVAVDAKVCATTTLRLHATRSLRRHARCVATLAVPPPFAAQPRDAPPRPHHHRFATLMRGRRCSCMLLHR
jgi:hypothetical protein